MFFSDKGFGIKNKSLEAFYTHNKLILPKNLSKRRNYLNKIINEYDTIDDIVNIFKT